MSISSSGHLTDGFRRVAHTSISMFDAVRQVITPYIPNSLQPTIVLLISGVALGALAQFATSMAIKVIVKDIALGYLFTVIYQHSLPHIAAFTITSTSLLGISTLIIGGSLIKPLQEIVLMSAAMVIGNRVLVKK